jgi:hypothetical protein
MFEQDTTRAFIEARPEEVLDIYNSINQSMVVVPQREPEKAQAFIASVYKQNLYHAYIYLYLSVANEGLLYRWSGGGVPGDQLNDIYQAALEFTESMGFMMDDMRYRDKSPGEKADIFAEVPLFHEDISFMKEHQVEEDAVEELVIESVESGESGIEVEAEDAEEIDLDLLSEDGEIAAVALPGGDDTEDVTEVKLGGGALDEPVEEAAVPEIPQPTDDVEEISIEVDEALGALEMGKPAAKKPARKPAPSAKAAAARDDEDSLLDSLEVEEEEGPEPSLDEDMLADEQTIEAAPKVDAVIEKKAEARTEEVDLTPEEEEVLEDRADASEAEEVEIPIEEEEPVSEEPPPEPEPPPPPPPAPKPKPAAAPEPQAHARSAPGKPLADGELTEEEYETLVHLLAMM